MTTETANPKKPSGKVKEATKDSESLVKKASKKKAIKKVENETKEVIAEKVRQSLYIYPEDLKEIKGKGEQQRRKKKFRQEVRTKVRSMVKRVRNLKKNPETETKDMAEALKKLRVYSKNHLTAAGKEKFKVEKVLS